MQIDAERGTLACNKYEVVLPNRPAISIAVTLEDLTRESVASWFGRGSRADHCGLIFIRGLDDGPAHPVCWIVRDSTLLLVGREADRSLTDELRQAVAKLLGVFFREIRGLAPDLSLLQLVIGDVETTQEPRTSIFSIGRTS